MKAVRTAAFVIGAAALVATGVGAAVGAGILGGVAAAGTAATFAGLSAATFTTIGVALSAAAGALSLAAGAAAPKGTVGGNATKFKIDKEAGIPVAIGRTYVGGNVVHRQYYNRPGDKMKNQLESWVTILSLGLVQSVGPLLIDKTPVAFDAGGQALGTYRGNMWLDTQRGACPEGRALAGPFGAFPGWDGSSRLSGLAADLWTLDFDSKGEKFPNGVPDRGRVLEGVLVYDPRRDSTYPGGNGPCRLGQPATYVYSENPGPHAITWAYGHYQNGVLVAGGGLSAGGIDMAPYVEWSNVCDANGWKVGGVVYATTDDAWDVLKMICQAGSATPLPVGAQLSVTFSAPRVSIGTISSADISGDVDVPATVARRTRRNTLIPSVRLESHGWEMVPLDPVSVPAYIAIDGGRRPREVSYPLVQDARQGAQLALYEMLNDRELSGIVVPAKVYALGYRPGDCITLQIPEANLIGREVVIGQRELDVGTNGVTLVCRSEDNSKHAFALGKTTTPPPTPDLSNPGVDRTAPDAIDWTAIGTTLTASGVAVPAIVITSLVDRIAAEEVVFDYRPHIPGSAPEVNWTGASIEPSSVLRKEITSVTSNTAYDVGIRYRTRGAVSARLIIDNVTVGNAVVGEASNISPGGTIGGVFNPGTGQYEGGVPVDGITDKLADVRQTLAEYDAVIVRVDKAVDDAGERITAARGRADEAYDRAGQAIEDAETVNRRVDTLIAEGGGGSDGVDSVARAEIKRVDEAAIGREGVIARSIDAVSARLELQPKSFVAVARGAGAAYTRESGIYDAEGNVLVGAARGYVVTRWTAENTIAENKVFDVLGGLYDGGALEMANYLNAVPDRVTVTIHSHDEPSSNRLLPFLIAAMWRVGAGELFTSAKFDYRGAYVLIGRTGIGKGNGVEIQRGTGYNALDAYIEQPFTLAGGIPQLDGAGAVVDARITRTETAFAEADAALARESVAIEARMSERVSASALDVTTAFTEADRALGSRSAVLEASAVAARAGSLVSNDTFSYWPDPAYLPPQWSVWNQNPEYFTRYQTPHSSGGYAFRARTPLDYQCGIAQYGCRFEAGWYVMEADAELLDGDWTGGGLTIEGAVSLDFAREPDINGVIGSEGFRRRRWSKLIYLDRAWNNWHLMMNWGPFAPLNYKFVDWYHCGVRPASDAEIAARKAIDVTIPAVAARVSVTESTLADLPSRFAAAERTEKLEAQVNFATDSGLKRSLEATVEARATAIANGAAGAVAQTVEGIRANFEGRIAGVEVAAGAIAAVDGRTEYYWQVTGTAPDGNAMIRLAKKDGSAPLFYVGANMIVDGSLLVTGSIDSLQVRDNAITGVAWGGGGTLFTSGGGVGGQVKTIDSGRLALAVTGKRVRVDYQFSGHQSPDFVSSANSTATVFLMQSNNGGAPFQVRNRRVQLEYGNLKYFNGFELTMPPAGTTEVFMRMQVYFANNGTAAWEVFDVLLTLEETKK